jgi:uncharacterized membrane protein YhaH (DUF805 family)
MNKERKMKNAVLDALKISFTFAGRATRKEFWSFYLFLFLVHVVFTVLAFLTEGSILGTIVGFLWVLLAIALLIPYISVSVRRLHDLNMSGFWLWFLNPFGLPIVFVVYLLSLDPACDRLVEKIEKIGSPWLGWILSFLFWPVGAFISLFLLFLYAGKKEDNDFGANPYEIENQQ